MAGMDEGLLTDESEEEVKTIPRINQQMIMKHKNWEVSIMGRYIRTWENQSSFLASDGAYFTVKYKNNDLIPQYDSQYNEIRGIPDKNGFILYISHTPYGNDLDMVLWNKFIKLTHKYPNLF